MTYRYTFCLLKTPAPKTLIYNSASTPRICETCSRLTLGSHGTRYGRRAWKVLLLLLGGAICPNRPNMQPRRIQDGQKYYSILFVKKYLASERHFIQRNRLILMYEKNGK